MLGTGSKEQTFAVLPLRDIVVFPQMIVPLFVGREKSVKALEHVMHNDKQVLLVTQKTPGEDDPKFGDLYEMGTVGSVLQLLKLPDGTVKVLVEGVRRAKIVKHIERDEFIEVRAVDVKDGSPVNEELQALARAVVTQF